MASSPSSNSPTSQALQFYDSILNNNLEQLRKLVEASRFDLNAKFLEVRRANHKDLCPVHLVSFKGYFSILHYLIQSGVDVNQTTSTLYRQPLHHAAMSHQLSCSQLLINAGGYIDAKDTFGNTPLHYAAEDGENNLLTLLLQNGASADSQDITNKTPLMKATRSGRIGTVKRLLSVGCNVNLKDKNEDTALHYAARQGSADLIQMLLKYDARIDVQNQWGLTPLMEAVSYSQQTVVQILVKHRCDLYKRDYRTGDTALHIAVRKNYVHLVQLLLSAGKWYVEYNFNNFGESFVHDAVVYNRRELVKLFLEHNYNFDYPAKRLPTGSTKSPLQLAMERGHLDLARVFSKLYCCGAPRSHVNSSLSGACGSSSSNSNHPKQYLINFNPIKRLDVLQEIDEVKSLKQWCRKVIRKSLGFHIEQKLHTLNLPPALVDFVMLSDIFNSIANDHSTFTSR